MDRDESQPGCAHHLFVVDGAGVVEPSHVCSCRAGLIHMHDCPVSMGLECVHFSARDESVESVSIRDEEEVRLRLMSDYLSRTYYHRLRSLAPQGSPWHMRHEQLAAEYEADDLREDREVAEETPEEVERTDASYEKEKERLIAQRRKREQQRQEQEEKSREQRAQERARRGIKTVVEKAQETVAQQGNVVSSYLDGVQLPGPDKGTEGPRRKRKRRRRGSKAGAGGESPARNQGGEGRARRRRGGRPAQKAGDAGAPAGSAQGSGGSGSGSDQPSKRRRRRRRRGRKGGDQAGKGESGNTPT